MADTDDTAPAAPGDVVSVTKRKRGRPPKPYAMSGRTRNKEYRARQVIRDRYMHQALGTLLGACARAGIKLPFIVASTLEVYPDLRHETIKQVRQLVKDGTDTDGTGAAGVAWLEANYRPETE